LRLHDYGCVLLDLGLPGQDGMAALAQLRDHGYTGAVLVITARDQVSMRIAGLDAGADDFLVKPFDLDELAAPRRADRTGARFERNRAGGAGVVSGPHPITQ
jgi:DNA-binding response OmpR family regulator